MTLPCFLQNVNLVTLCASSATPFVRKITACYLYSPDNRSTADTATTFLEIKPGKPATVEISVGQNRR
jgi:hypothetical protein